MHGRSRVIIDPQIPAMRGRRLGKVGYIVRLVVCSLFGTYLVGQDVGTQQEKCVRITNNENDVHQMGNPSDKQRFRCSLHCFSFVKIRVIMAGLRTTKNLCLLKNSNELFI